MRIRTRIYVTTIYAYGLLKFDRVNFEQPVKYHW